MRVEFLKSGVKPADYPFPYKPEVAVVGRSNAGKSSLINALTGHRIAKVSQTPGKTRLLNFFAIADKLYLVDMPGYGYATGSRAEVESWKGMIETYLKERETLRGVMLIMDIRRDWSAEEEQLREWFNFHNIRWCVLLNKAEKFSRSRAMQIEKKLQAKIGAEVPVFAVSALKKSGLDPVKNLIFKEWPK